jgi:hypothetical protein
MRGEDLPESVKMLIAERIDSVPELEAILLLRAHPDRQWAPAETGARLYVSATMAAWILSALSERGFFARSGEAYRYAAATPELEQGVDLLADCYARDLIAVTTAIHSKPNASVRQFADAFRLRKGK